MLECFAIVPFLFSLFSRCDKASPYQPSQSAIRPPAPSQHQPLRKKALQRVPLTALHSFLAVTMLQLALLGFRAQHDVLLPESGPMVNTIPAWQWRVRIFFRVLRDVFNAFGCRRLHRGRYSPEFGCHHRCKLDLLSRWGSIYAE